MIYKPQKMQKTLCLQTFSEEATLGLGRAMGGALMEVVPSEAGAGVTMLLSGGLGAGKTALVRGIGGALGAARIRSPSFTLINEYRTARFFIVHADLYRLTPDEAKDLGLEEYHEAPCVLLVEWAERIAWGKWEAPPERDVLKIFIESRGENERVFEISSRGKDADLVLQNLIEAIKDGKIDPGIGLQLALD